MARTGILRPGLAEVVSEGKKYIGDLYANDSLAPFLTRPIAPLRWLETPNRCMQ
jgi:hypothetical protein